MHVPSGTYSNGGCSPYFNNIGKIFTSLAKVKAHLKSMEKHRAYAGLPIYDYKDCVLEVYDLNQHQKQVPLPK